MAGDASLNGLGIALLALLTERPMHPYEMHSLLLERQEDRIVKVRRGTLYHTVEKLTGAGLVEEAATERNGNRPPHTVYRITSAGDRELIERITQVLENPVNEFPVFPVALAEAHVLPEVQVVHLLDKRISLLRAELEEIEAGIALAETAGVARRFWIDVEYRRTLQIAEITWLETLRQDIEKGNLPWR